MNGRVLSALFVLAAAATTASAQTPALSGLAPTPAPPAATSEATPTPTPAPKLKSVAGPAAESGRSGQSLADVVRISKEARSGQKPRKSLGTISNENVRKGAPTPAPGAKGAAKTPAAPAAVQRAATPVPTYDVPRDDQGRSEAQWKSTMDHARALVLDGERRVRELETKSKQLENDFYAQSDGFRRDGVIKPAWDKSREDLAQARAALDAARKALEDLSEDARRSNTPPGWLR